MSAPLRTITYPSTGEVRVTFRLPEDWKEDANVPGMGLFYPEPEGSPGGPWPTGGMLAVNIETKSFAPPLTPDAADAQVRANSKDPNQILRLGPDRWLIRGKSYKQELSHRSVVHIWVLVRLLRPDLLARVGFVFTGADAFFDNPGDPGYDTIDLLDHEIVAAQTSQG